MTVQKRGRLYKLKYSTSIRLCCRFFRADTLIIRRICDKRIVIPLIVLGGVCKRVSPELNAGILSDAYPYPDFTEKKM